jgi:hypothetical protein
MAEPILTGSSETLLWQGLVQDAETRASRQLGENLESYLVFTLMRHKTDAHLGRRVMAIEWLESLVANGRRRQEGLRDVGDNCLLIAGLYPEQAERRRVSLSYFQDLGRNAYENLGERSQGGLETLFRELARAFAVLVRVLFEVRRLADSATRLDPGLAYAWCESHGRIVPERAAEVFPGAIVLEGPATRN